MHLSVTVPDGRDKAFPIAGQGDFRHKRNMKLRATLAVASGVTGREAATGPIMFQGDHGPVAYRNINITPLKK
ncbi:MAG: hypothetical protein VCA34_11250 [Roseibacillus sp.]